MSYPYQSSQSGYYELRRDGQHVTCGTESELWNYLHNVTSCSVSHALTFEGYEMVPLRMEPARDRNETPSAT